MDSNSYMSFVNVLILAAVALVFLGGWLIFVFRADTSPVASKPRKHAGSAVEAHEVPTFAQVMGISD